MPLSDSAGPPALGPAFTVASALAHGTSYAELRRRGLLRPFHGLRSIRPPPREGGRPGDHLRAATADLLPRLGSRGSWAGAYSHTTALILLGCPIRCPLALHVTSRPPRDRIRLAGVQGHRVSEPFEFWRDRGGLPIVPPELALVQAASILPFRELVIAADHLAKPRRNVPGEAPIRPLRILAAQADRARSRGVHRLRAALPYARVGAESRMETLLRLVMAEFGLDVLELQGEIHDEKGRWIGRFDMVDRARRLIIEYDGEQHRLDRDQYLRDHERLERARAAGYRILRLHREDLLNRPGRTVTRIADFLGMPLRPVTSRQRQYFAER